MPSGAATRQTKRSRFAPRSLRRASALAALPPVASIGSTSTISASGPWVGDRLVVADRRELRLVAVHAEVADARLRHQPEEALDHPEPGAQDRDHDDVVAEARAARGLERRGDVDLLQAQVAQRLEADQHRRLAQAAAELAARRRLVAQHAEMAGHERVIDDGHSIHARARYSLGPVSGPRRNVELKATDPEPARTLERALALGAADQGVIVQRDTYFRVGEGRLKLREEEPGGAHLISYSRPDDASVRVSAYRVVPAPEGLLPALTESLGVDVVVEKRRHLLLWETVRIHLDEVTGLGSFVELEAVADAALRPVPRARADRAAPRRPADRRAARGLVPNPQAGVRPLLEG